MPDQLYNITMSQFEYNPIPWSEFEPTKPGLYLVRFLAEDATEKIYLVDIYPDKGNLLVNCDKLMFVQLERFATTVKYWSPRINWDE